MKENQSNYVWSCAGKTLIFDGGYEEKKRKEGGEKKRGERRKKKGDTSRPASSRRHFRFLASDLPLELCPFLRHRRLRLALASRVLAPTPLSPHPLPFPPPFKTVTCRRPRISFGMEVDPFFLLFIHDAWIAENAVSRENNTCIFLLLSPSLSLSLRGVPLDTVTYEQAIPEYRFK